MKMMSVILPCAATVAIAAMMMWQSSKDSAQARRIFGHLQERENRIRELERRIAEQERSLDSLRGSLLDLRLFAIPEAEPKPTAE